MKKLLATGAILAVAAIALSGCASHSSDEQTGPNDTAKTLKFYSVALPDGKNVDCVGSLYSGAVIEPDCDWANSYGGSPNAESGSLQSYVVTSPAGVEITCVGSRYTGSVIHPDCDWPIASTR